MQKSTAIIIRIRIEATPGLTLIGANGRRISITANWTVTAITVTVVGFGKVVSNSCIRSAICQTSFGMEVGNDNYGWHGRVRLRRINL